VPPRSPTRSTILFLILLAAAACGGAEGGDGGRPAALELLNVSYDPTRELWRDLNARFAAKYEQDRGVRLTINQSHGGSSTQARSVIDGLEADVVTLASIIDVNAIAKSGLIGDGWVDELPERSLPYYSTIVFVVRRGNPKGIRDWADLVKPDVEVITPNPKTSGNGYLSFFAAWGSVVLRGGSHEDALAYVTQLYRNVPVLDSGARAATTTFVQKGIGDVHLAWENEAHLEVAEAGGTLEIVYPSISIRAEPHVAVVDANVDRRGTRAAAQAYLEYTYTEEAQEVIAQHFYRPADAAVLEKHAETFPSLELFAVTEIAASFQDAHARFIAEGGVFDQIYGAAR
jgi:sulfate transport system substrate-binding protein